MKYLIALVLLTAGQNTFSKDLVAEYTLKFKETVKYKIYITDDLIVTKEKGREAASYKIKNNKYFMVIDRNNKQIYYFNKKNAKKAEYKVKKSKTSTVYTKDKTVITSIKDGRAKLSKDQIELLKYYYAFYNLPSHNGLYTKVETPELTENLINVKNLAKADKKFLSELKKSENDLKNIKRINCSTYFSCREKVKTKSLEP